MSQRDYKSQKALGHAHMGGAMPDSELGGALALRLGNACDQSLGFSRRVPMGAEISPPGLGQKPDSPRLREAGALLLVAGGSGSVEGAPRTDFAEER